VSTFYIVCAGASATLVGLLFVAVQFGPPLVREGRLGPRHAVARSTFTVFGVVFMVSLLYLVPDITLHVRAIAAIAAAAFGALRAVRTWIPVWRDKFAGRVELRLWQTVWLLVGPVLVYVVLAIAGVRQLNAPRKPTLDENASYAFVVLFVIGLRNSWNLLVESTALARRDTER
jgi:hypothetical protein